MRTRTRAWSMVVLSMLIGTAAAASDAAAAPVQGAPPVSGDVTPAGWQITPAGRQVDVLRFPLGLAPTADGSKVVVTSNGGGVQGLTVVDAASMTAVPTPASNLFLGLSVTPAGEVYAGAGNADRVYRFRLVGPAAVHEDLHEALVFPTDSAVDAAGGRIVGTPPTGPAADGIRVTSYPGNSVLSGTLLYVGGTLSEPTGKTAPTTCPSGQPACGRVTIVDTAAAQVVRRVPVGLDAYGLAIDTVRHRLYVSNWADESGRGRGRGGTVSVVDVSDPANAHEIGYAVVGHQPTAVQLSADRNRLFVANANDDTISVLDVSGADAPRVVATESVRPAGVPVGTHPDALALSPDGRTLFVALAGLNAVELRDGASGAPLAGQPLYIPTGWYPSALAVTGDAQHYRLWVANAKGTGFGPGYNGSVLFEGTRLGGSVSAIDLPASAAQVAAWTAQVRADSHLAEGSTDPCAPSQGVQVSQVLCPAAAGIGGTRGPAGRLPATGGAPSFLIAIGAVGAALLLRRAGVRRGVSAVVLLGLVGGLAAGAGGGRAGAATVSPIRHVVYIVTENKTFDQYFGDLTAKAGFDADPSYTVYGSTFTPNHHALAGRYSLGDRFFSDAEVSVTGHSWTSGAIATDHNERTWPADYDQGIRGTHGGGDPLKPSVGGTPGHVIAEAEDELQDPEGGYIFEAFKRAGAQPPGTPGARLTMGIYGERTAIESGDMDAYKAPRWKDGDLQYFDTCRAAEFITGKAPDSPVGADSDYFRNCDGRTLPDAFNLRHWTDVWNAQHVDAMPNFIYMSLPVNHTLGTNLGSPTPASMVADNDYAVGLIVEALSKSPFWGSTAVIQTEDDTQAAGDHISPLRDYLEVSSPWARKGPNHQWGSMGSLLRTVETIFGVPPIALNDRLAEPQHDAFLAHLDDQPDLTPYTAIRPAVPFALNQPGAPGQATSMAMDWSTYDRVDEATLNAILYAAARGGPAQLPSYAPR